MHDTIDGMKRLTLADYQALAEFRYQIRKFLHFSEQAVEAAGLERGQYQLMLAIKGMPENVAAADSGRGRPDAHPASQRGGID